MLVCDVAYDGFKEIFDGDDAGYGAVLIDDDAHVLLGGLHLAKEFGDHLGFGDEDGGALNLGDGAGDGVGVGDLEKVMGEGDAGDVVQRLAEDGDAGEDVFLDGGGELFEREGGGDGEDLGAGGHDLADDLVAELDDGAEEFAVGLFEDALLFSGFKESVHGLRGMVFFGLVFRLGEGDDGEQEAEQEGDGEDEIEERLDEETDAQNPEAARAGEEDLGEEAVEDENEEDEFEEGGEEFGPATGEGQMRGARRRPARRAMPASESWRRTDADWARDSRPRCIRGSMRSSQASMLS